MTLKNKRYFWIQLTQDFFKSKEMKLLRKIAGGDTHTIIYLKMMLISLEDGGRIYYDGLADNLAEELSLVIDENVEDIKITLIFLESKGLLTKKSDRDYFLEQVPEMVGSETASARRVRKFRENKLALQCNNDETKRNGDIDKEIDIDKELDKEKDIDLDKNPIEIIVEEYQSRIAMLDGTQFEILKEFVTLDGMEAKVVLRAIGLAADNGKRNFSYIKAILTNWKNDGVLAIAAVDERERAFKESKNKGSNNQTNKKSNVPEWSNPDYVNTTSEETKEELERRKKELLNRLEKGDN